MLNTNDFGLVLSYALDLVAFKSTIGSVDARWDGAEAWFGSTFSYSRPKTFGGLQVDYV